MYMLAGREAIDLMVLLDPHLAVGMVEATVVPAPTPVGSMEVVAAALLISA